ncbi:MAG: HD domain-containing protein [Candidatus Woesearchaeota archaeon]
MSIQKQLYLLKKYALPENKFNHSVNVARIAYFIAEQLEKKSIDVDKNKVYVGALLHDIGYALALTEHDKINHAELAAAILKDEGFGEYSDIVLKHSIKSWISKLNAPLTLEEKVVNYSDKRDKNGRIVTLAEREKIFLYSLKYEADLIKNAFEEVRKFEKEIFSIINKKPENLKDIIMEKFNI